MSIRTTPLPVDAALIGGGIAGLWLLARLRQQGYSALLIENRQLGAGQTLCAQGIIHGGAKYHLGVQASALATAIAAMPTRWRQCLRGAGDVDLRAARLLSDHQYLWAPRAPGARLTAFFASRLMRARMAKIAPPDYPPALRFPQFQGVVYRLEEPVVDVASVLAALAAPHEQAMMRHEGALLPDSAGELTLSYAGQSSLTLRPRCLIFTAGAGNAALPWVSSQSRPLHMVLARGPALPGPLYAHCLGTSDTPRLTITSHSDAQDRLIWYLGGGLAEEGVTRDHATQIAAARRELAALLPWVDWAQVELASFTVARAEPRQAQGRRPDSLEVQMHGRSLAAWPTKLALAPMLADHLEKRLAELGITPQPLADSALADWPRPPIAVPPWDWENLAWS